LQIWAELIIFFGERNTVHMGSYGAEEKQVEAKEEE
jgi:hypothetical protein